MRIHTHAHTNSSHVINYLIFILLIIKNKLISYEFEYKKCIGN